MRLAYIIRKIESQNGTDCGRGDSGEYGCFQFLPETWKLFSKEVLGYVAPQTIINEEYVATIKIEKWLRQGLTVKEVALRWNQGSHKKKCSAGVNKFGVEYNSCEYVNLVLKHY
ncbi:MAG: hypothetical protein KJI69_05190 [Patescibacteria group bacterium]|nr:hypothetical protein [Patescibacteria group bacterium]